MLSSSAFIALKAIEFNGVDTKCFLRNFVILMYLFLFIDILKSYWKNTHVVKKINGKFITEKLFFKGFDTFLAQTFFWVSGFCLIF